MFAPTDKPSRPYVTGVTSGWGGGAVRGEEGEDTGFEQEGGNLPDVSYQGSPGVCQAF